MLNKYSQFIRIKSSKFIDFIYICISNRLNDEHIVMWPSG